ncbi:MAG: L,D-transpeptidase family protein [Hyphomicrobium sp.]|jgi:murein L,D-transpeptidase YcbB/YkuD
MAVLRHFAVVLLLPVLFTTLPAGAELKAQSLVTAGTPPESATAASDAAAPAVPASPAARALEQVLAAAPPPTASDEEKKEAAALAAFYQARGHEPVWIDAKGLNATAAAIAAEIGNARAYALDPRDFALPDLQASVSAANLSPEASAGAEIMFSRAILKYARFARGGRIIAPSELLSTHLDRRPQLLDPKLVLDEIAASSEPAAYLAKTNPQHPQFARLREKYVALTAGSSKPGKAASAEAARLQANMEMWRWMAPDLGDLYMMANVPEFMIRLVKGGEVVHTERIVAGETGKQTSIFSRPLKSIVFRPMWRVPESIKVKELWPSLIRGGGLFRQYGLELQTKAGASLDYHAIDWTKSDIRDYEVVQPPGPRSVLGVVKFTFPSQHTVYMHDTPDKWMFNSAQRTLSHGCLRLRNPVRMSELILAEDKGWDAAKIAEVIKGGPLNNEVALEKKVRMHITYFTAWVDDAGRLKTYADVYGHEKRVAQALAGKWDQIAKGEDHLAPVQPNKAALAQTARTPKPQQEEAFADFISGFLPGGL